MNCEKAETITITDKTIDGGIVAKGYCTVVVKDSTVNGDVALITDGDARVELKNVKLNGVTRAIVASGRSVVVVDTVDFKAGIMLDGSASIDRKGPIKRVDQNNDDAGVKDENALAKAEPIKCVGSKTMTIKNAYIKTDRDGVFVQGRCDVRIENSRIVSEDDGIVVQGKSKIYLKDTEIRAKDNAIRLVGGALLEIEGSLIKGEIKRVGGAKIVGHGKNSVNQ